MRTITTHAAALYLGAGLFGGLLMAAAVPAINPVGVIYYAATWPAQIYCAPVARGCTVAPSPAWAGFMFSGLR